MQTEKFKIYLLQRCISQRHLAKQIGMTPKTFCEKVNGKKEFKAKEWFAVCDALGIENPREFFE